MSYEYTFIEDSPFEIVAGLSEKVKRRRLEKGLSRKALSEISGVPLGTIAKFEQKHSIALQQFADLAVALGYADQLKSLLAEPRYKTIGELETIKANQNRKRGSSK